jgi:hypothetical protein
MWHEKIRAVIAKISRELRTVSAKKERMRSKIWRELCLVTFK